MESVDTLSAQKFKRLLEQESVKLPSAAVNLLSKIKSTLSGSNSVGPFSHSDAKIHLGSLKVAWPWNFSQSSEHCSFSYAAPSRIETINIVALCTTSVRCNEFFFVPHQNSISIDLAIEMPHSLFHPKDFLDYRYFHKRSFYLSHVAALVCSIINVDDGTSLNFIFDKDDPRLPVIVLTIPFPKNKKTCAKIYIRPCVPDGLFRKSRLLPLCNNVRQADPSLSSVPTPFYNACLLADTLLMTHFGFLREASILLPSFTSCVRLIEVWCKKQCLRNWTYTLQMLMAYWAHGVQVSREWSALQLFRSLMFFLSNHNFTSVFPLFDASKPADFDLNDFKNVKGAAFVDSNGYNLTYWATTSDVEHLVLYSKQALALLESNDLKALFQRERSIHVFDHLCLVPIPSEPPAFYNPKVKLDHPCLVQYLKYALPTLFQKSLSHRIVLSTCLSDAPFKIWSVHEAPPSTSAITHLKFGFLQLSQPSRTLDFGPCPESDLEGAKEFCRIWGERAELRRFPDGQIKYCVEWPDSEDQFSFILDYLLNRHLSVSGVHEHAFPLLQALPPVSPCMQAFQSLSKHLFSLQNLPLPITAIIPLSSHLTGCALSNDTPATACIQLEKSERWPKHDPVALYHMMMLYLIRVANALASRDISAQIIRSPLAIEIQYLGTLFQLSLDIDGKQHAALGHAVDMAALIVALPSLSKILRLFKLWLAKQMLSIYLHDTVAELIVVEAVLNSRLYPTLPSDPKSGLLRVLEFTANISGDIFVSTRNGSSIEKSHEPALDPPTVSSCRIASSHVDFRIPAMIINRLKYLSKVASGIDFPLQLLKPSLSDYDAYVHLKRSKHTDAYIADIVRLYSPYLFVFYNPLDPSLFALVFDPDTLKERPWKPFLIHPKILENDFMVMDHKSVLNEIERLGKGLVRKIVVNS